MGSERLAIEWLDRYVLLAFYLEPGQPVLVQLVERIEDLVAKYPQFGPPTDRHALVLEGHDWIPRAALKPGADGFFDQVDYRSLDPKAKDRLECLPPEYVTAEREDKKKGLPIWYLQAMPRTTPFQADFDSTISFAVRLDLLQEATSPGQPRDFIDQVVGIIAEARVAFSGHVETIYPFESPQMMLYTSLNFGKMMFPRFVDRVLWWSDSPKREECARVRGVYWGNWYSKEVLATLDPTGEFVDWFETIGSEDWEAPVTRYPDGSAFLTITDIPHAWEMGNPRTDEMIIRLHRQLRDARLTP